MSENFVDIENTKIENKVKIKVPRFSSGQKRKRVLSTSTSEGLHEGLIKVARCFKKRKSQSYEMGSGCTKGTARNVIKPIPVKRGSSCSIETDRKVKQLPVPIRGSGNNELTSLPHAEETKHEKEAALNSSKHFQDGRNLDKENRPSLNQLKILNKRSSSNDESLKHYQAQTNLLERKHLKRQESIDDVFEVKPENEKTLKQENVMQPPVTPRQKRQPTIHNSVCFQEDDQINHYQIQEEIGRGSFAAVYKCISSKTNQTYAMKVISKKRMIRKTGFTARHPRKGKSNPLDGLHREIAILKKVDHPCIVKLVEVIDDSDIDDVYMVFELMKSGPALEIPTDSPLSEEKARRYFRDTILGLEYLHHTKIIHRDIKPSNLLLDNNDHVKIADFGVSDMFEGEDDTLNRFAGSPAFQAPEAISEGRSKFSGKAADIWALGVTLYSFIYGIVPFNDKDVITLYERIKNEKLVFPDEPIVDPQLQDLICRLLSKDAKQRIKIADIKNHPWVTQGGRELLPETNEHCVAIEVSDEDVKNSVTILSRLSSLVLVKTILNRKTFSRKGRKSSTRSSSTPDIGQIDENSYSEFTKRTAKSATLLSSSAKNTKH
eukprot:gene14015-15473_t